MSFYSVVHPSKDCNYFSLPIYTSKAWLRPDPL